MLFFCSVHWVVSIDKWNSTSFCQVHQILLGSFDWIDILHNTLTLLSVQAVFGGTIFPLRQMHDGNVELRTHMWLHSMFLQAFDTEKKRYKLHIFIIKLKKKLREKIKDAQIPNNHFSTIKTELTFFQLSHLFKTKD